MDYKKLFCALILIFFIFAFKSIPAEENCDQVLTKINKDAIHFALSNGFFPNPKDFYYGHFKENEPFNPKELVMTEGLVPAKKDKLYGYVNNNDDWVIEPQFQIPGKFKNGRAIIYTQIYPNPDRAGVIDIKGKYIIDPKYKSIYSMNNQLFLVYGDKIQYIFDLNGKTLFSTKKYYLSNNYNEGLLSFNHDGKYGYIDKNGKIIIKPSFDNANQFNDGLAAVQINKNWGYIDKKGKLVIPAKFKDYQAFNNGLAAVQIEEYFDENNNLQLNKWGFIDKNGNIVIKAMYEHVSDFFDNYALATLNKSEISKLLPTDIFLINKTGEKVCGLNQ